MPTEMSRVEEHSVFYGFLKRYVDFCFRAYFRTTIQGFDTMNKEGSLIFAPNHQNALMDALALLSVSKWQPVFLARADIFKKSTIRKILTLFKIMPVYRMRDGYENLTNNDATFLKTIDVLKNRNGLVILPEGNHGDQKRLRPLKKGIVRIAFQAEDAADGQLDIRIVPVGIDYTHYVRVGSQLHIRFGIPIRVSPLLSEYRENPARAYRILLELIEGGMKHEMIHIADEKFHSCIKVAIESFAPWYLRKIKAPLNHPGLMDVQQKLAIKIEELRVDSPDDYLVRMAMFMEYERELKLLGAQSSTFPAAQSGRLMASLQLLMLVALLPIFMYALANNMLPLIISLATSKKFADVQFHSSIRFVMGILLFPIFHILQSIAVGVVIGNWYIAIAYLATLPLSVIFYFEWRRHFFSVLIKLKELVAMVTKPDLLKRALSLHEKLVLKMDELYEKDKSPQRRG
jgi:1-acyl-sn-glycerol-3-phosphate acyltransferase